VCACEHVWWRTWPGRVHGHCYEHAPMHLCISFFNICVYLGMYGWAYMEVILTYPGASLVRGVLVVVIPASHRHISARGFTQANPSTLRPHNRASIARRREKQIESKHAITKRIASNLSVRQEQVEAQKSGFISSPRTTELRQRTLLCV
jgi:hypothetical protein